MKNTTFPKVSIIVPVYNVVKHLPKCLESIKNQTLKDIEVIMVCDGGDEDMRICEKYAKLDTRFSLIKNIKKGLGGARNAGIEAANSEFLMFIDSDDAILPTMCEKMLKPIENDKSVDMVQCGTEIIFEGEIDYKLKSQDDLYFDIKRAGKVKVSNDLYGSLNVGTWNKLYRKQLILKYNLKFPENMRNEDAYFSWCYWSVCNNIYCIKEKLYQYLRRSDSLMAHTFDKKLGLEILHHLIIAEGFYDFLITNNLFGKYQVGFWNAYQVSWWFVKNNLPDDLSRKGIEKAYSFLVSHTIPSSSKYDDLREVLYGKISISKKTTWINHFVKKTIKGTVERYKLFGIIPYYKRVLQDDTLVSYFLGIPLKCHLAMTIENHIIKNGSSIKVTAVLPIFKCEKYLRRCIDSVLSQTLKDIEVILACDGGQECFDICDEYVKKDKRVRLIKDAGSYGKSVNAGIKEARGEYICIIECDDWCSSTMFDELYTQAKYYDVDVVKAGWYDAFDDKSRNKERIFGYPDGFFNIFEHLEFLAFQPSVWSGIYRKSYLLNNDILFKEDRQSYVDAPFHYETLLHTEDYILYNKPLYYYYQDNPTQSVKSGGKIYDGINAEIFAYRRILKHNGLWERAGEGYVNSLISHIDWNDKRLVDPQENRLFRKAVKHFVSQIDFKNMSFFLLDDYKLKQLSFFAGKNLTRTPTKVSKKTYKLLGVLPIWEIVTKNNKLIYTCLNIPIFGTKNKTGSRKFLLFNVFPLLTIRTKEIS